MACVLKVAAFQFGNPVVFFVLVETRNTSVHKHSKN